MIMRNGLGEARYRWQGLRRALLLGLGLLVLPKAAEAALIQRNVTNVTQLVQLFTDANADFNNTYEGTLTATTYNLTSTLNLTRGNVVLKGGNSISNATSYVIDCQDSCSGGGARGHVFRVVRASGHVGNVTLVLWGVTVQRGNSTEVSLRGGGGAWVESAYLEIHDSVIRSNKASQWGAGLLAGVDGTLVLRDSKVENNQNTQITGCGPGQTSVAGGIGVLHRGAAYIYNSSISGNKACRGGGIGTAGDDTNPSRLYINNSTISGNHANYHGGGILIWGPMRQVEIGFSTIAFNRGGVNSNGGDLTYGGGIAFRNFKIANPAITPPLRMYGSILAKNTLDLGSDGADCFKQTGSTMSASESGVANNFIGKNGNCGTWLNWTSTTGGTTLVGTEASPLDPQLDPGLTGNPGAHWLMFSSPARNEYTSGNRSRNLVNQVCPTTDQTKVVRGPDVATTPTHCDIGAAESSGWVTTSFQALTLAPGWTNNSFGGRTAAVAVDAERQVHLKGAIANGTNSLIFTLPSGMRPSAWVYVPVDLYAARKGRLIINPTTGEVFVAAESQWSDAQNFTSLEGVSFPLDAVQFTPLTLQNGWFNAQYTNRNAAVSTAGGIVRLQGAISTQGTNMSPFVLPPGARPATDTYINIDLCSATKGRLLINPTGTVTVEPAGGAVNHAQCFTSLEGAWFALSATGYSTMSLDNNWTQAPYSTRNAAVSVERGVVSLRGAISTFLENPVMFAFTLPPGARPSTSVWVPVTMCSAAGGRLNIAANTGEVTLQAEHWASDATCFTSLEGVRFGL
jgi:hypothetical protein